MSRQAIDILALTIAASGAIVANRFVDNTAAQGAADDNTLGVARTDAADGEDFALTVLGTAVVESGGALTAGDPVSSDASGRAVKTDGTTYTTVSGRVLPGQSASAAGEFLEILLIIN